MLLFATMDDQIIAISLWAERRYLEAVSQNPAKRAFWRAVLERAESQLEARVREVIRECGTEASGDPVQVAGAADAESATREHSENNLARELGGDF